MSSHREAPQIAKDPVADSTDVYAFVSPDAPSTVTLIANYIPLEGPDGGPNFYEYDDSVLYSINVDNDGDGVAEIAYQFRFQTVNNDPFSFLYNDAPITSLTPPAPGNAWNRQQTYSLTRVDYSGFNPFGTSTLLGSGLLSPPCNVGPLSTPNYPSLAKAAIHKVGRGIKVFAGQRAEGFYVDLGAVFDLGNLRPFEAAQAFAKGIGLANMPGVNSTDQLNVHTLALQIPIDQLTGRTPTGVTDPAAVIGVWTTASRQKVRIYDQGQGQGGILNTGPFVQVSRLGNPLVNELLTPIGQKDFWNTQEPVADKQFLANFTNPLLAQLLPTLYPGVFDHLAAYNKKHTPTPGRIDLEAILLLGIPAGIVAPDFSTFPATSLASAVPADLLRLNVLIPPASTPNSLGVLGGDVAGFPNGRRVFDDVATIELRAVAGATLPLVNSLTGVKYTADPAAGVVNFGLEAGGGSSGEDGTDLRANNTEFYLPSFPYLGHPHSGYNAHTPAARKGK
ncbi:MAG: DUF4331 domain-containing protein [Actinomycetota bacterium]|nr:DUF4331 domain-containing protein [Actinomycetota bacterium]